MQNILKQKVIRLRQNGLTYSEIIKSIEVKIPKSTISYWCNDVKMSRQKRDRINQITVKNALRSRLKALEVNKTKKQNYLFSIKKENLFVNDLLKKKDVSKLSLALLYLAEGAKSTKGSLMFGNSNPDIIKLFLKLLRKCYDIDEEKFRCTLQCRADQNIKQLETFWSETTGIPLNKFYRARVDQRTVHKVSRKKDYKGVCRIDYFSAHIYHELKIIAEIIYEGL